MKSIKNLLETSSEKKGETMEFIKELWAFLRIRKKLWLAPIILVMFVLGGLLILAKGSILAPLIYTIF